MEQRTENVRIQLASGKSIWAEVSSVGPREQDVVFEGVAEALSLDAVRDGIIDLANLTLDAIKQVSPTRAAVEFGLELALESGKLTALWVKGSGKANLKVTLEWQKEEPKANG